MNETTILGVYNKSEINKNVNYWAERCVNMAGESQRGKSDLDLECIKNFPQHYKSQRMINMICYERLTSFFSLFIASAFKSVSIMNVCGVYARHPIFFFSYFPSLLIFFYNNSTILIFLSFSYFLTITLIVAEEHELIVFIIDHSFQTIFCVCAPVEY